ncbi:MAG TPA: alpha/beta hydrolase-fold protein [Longimicrobiales bacterium]|nr:alpha/beta hydrolase-fold protein [Longimicrobiales bacterium]
MRSDPAASRLLFAVLVALGARTVEASAQVDGPGGYSIEGTMLYTVFSTEVGDTFQVAVAPPLVPHDRDARLPLVLMADADLAFGATAQIVRLMQIRGELPLFLLVGVGYGSMEEARVTRARDLTPSHDSTSTICQQAGGCGGAERFLTFIEEDLLPFLGARFRLADDRTFYGASLGGLFGVYALLRDQGTFRRWVLGSPAVAFADFAVYDVRPKEGMSAGPAADAVFVGVGGEEGAFVGHARGLVDILEARDLARNVILDVFEGEHHMSVQPMVLARGMRTVFEAVPPSVAGGR